jgi:alkylation response protein AidB-like acyl-CoA dehydrogenase
MEADVDLTTDPLLVRLGAAVRSRLAEVPGDATADEVATLRELDGFALAAPVGAGGFDLGLGCGIVVSGELGRRASADVYGGSMLVLDALAAGGDGGELAGRLATGALPVLLAGYDTARVSAERRGGDWTLSGTVSVPSAGSRGFDLCVAVHTEDEVFLVLLAEPVWRDRTTGTGRDLSTVDVEGLAVGGSERVGTLGTGEPLTDPGGVLARARVRQAAYLHGLGAGAHELAVGHATRRRQFGRPLLEFQGVSFPLARAAIELAATRLAVQQAAWLADAGRPFALAAVQALALAADTALTAVRTAVQVHGARGMADTSQVHGHHQAVRQAVTRFGDPGRLWREAGLRRLEAATRSAEPAAELAVSGRIR